MSQTFVALPTIEQLNDFVRKTLCEHDRLDPVQTPFFGSRLVRLSAVCGMLFHVEGPRMLKTSAVWSAEEHRILFYDSTGVRFHEVKLSESPPPEAIPLALAA